jgi:hypothetical protein
MLSRVDATAVPEKHDVAVDLPKQIAQEEDHLELGDVLPMKVQVKTQTLPLTTDGYRRDRRDAVVPVAMLDDGCFAARRPGAADVGDQKEAAFVQEGEVRLQPPGFFLTATQRYRFQRSIASLRAVTIFDGRAITVIELRRSAEVTHLYSPEVTQGRDQGLR